MHSRGVRDLAKQESGNVHLLMGQSFIVQVM